MHLNQYNQIFTPYEMAGLLVVTGRPRAYNAKMVQVDFDKNPADGDTIYMEPDASIQHIRGIRAITSSQIVSKTDSGTTKSIPAADGYKDAVLVLVNHSGSRVASIPLNVLTTESCAGKPAYFDTPVHWEQCYIEFRSNTAGLDTDDAFLIEVWTD